MSVGTGLFFTILDLYPWNLEILHCFAVLPEIGNVFHNWGIKFYTYFILSMISGLKKQECLIN
jgi:hypothetical protein